MIQKLKRYALIVTTGLTLLAPGLVPVAVTHADNTITTSTCSGANAAAGGGATSCSVSGSGDTLNNVANTVVKYFSIIVGAIAVIMVIYGGFRYITSGGDSNNVSAAKNTLIYAIVGLLIVVVAQLIVHFVIGSGTNINNSNGNGTSGP